jgi:D-inositol-3-phosphate glycosyltransferase
LSKQIVIVGPAHPLRGGLATYNQLLAAKLQQQGHTVKIITFSLQYPNFLFPGKTQYSTDPKPDKLNIEVALNSISPFNWLRLGKKIRNQKPDLVIFRYWMPFMGPCLGTLGRIVRKNKHTKVVAITDNIIPHERRFFDKPFTSYFLKSCDGFVTMSRAVLEDLQEFNVTKPAAYNPHPMYESFGPEMSKEAAIEKLGLEQDTSYLLFFGFIRKYKGLDLLLRAFAKSGLTQKKVKLIIAGEYYDKPDEYQQIIKDEDLAPYLVQANDFIPDSEVSTYFSACDMVVQTYKSATQSGVTQVAYYYHKPMLVTECWWISRISPRPKGRLCYSG